MTKVITFLLCLCLATSYSSAQLEFLKKKAEEKIEQAIEGKEEEKTEQKQEEQKPAEQKKIEPVKAELKSYTKYDFVPGDKTLFFEDFSQDAIGDFPQLWTTNGSGEIRTVDGIQGQWLYATSKDNVYCLMKDLELPENFIFEFDVIPGPEDAENSNLSGFYFSLFNTSEDFLQDGLLPGHYGFHLTATEHNWTAVGYNEGNYLNESSSELSPIKIGQLNHIIVWVQKRRIRVYHEGLKIIDGPTALPQENKFNRLRFSMWGMQGHPFLSNLKITTAAADTRSKLLTAGKLISYGIYFDINKDAVKAESYGALNDIAKVLKDNPTVKIKIIGHTDSDGKPEANLSLSKKRAESVKNSLVSVFGIDGSRIETDGKGQTEPIEDNSTPQGKATNRRVEFIKL
jgi:OmpA-OmpF porin, OOP family